MAKKKRSVRSQRIKKIDNAAGLSKSPIYLYEDWKSHMPQWLQDIAAALDHADPQKAKELLAEETLQKNLAKLSDLQDIYFSKYEIALLLVRTFQGQRALEYCFDALKLGESILVYNVIALIYERMGKCDLVIEYLKKAKKLDPKNISLDNNLAICLMKIGKTQEAFSLFRKAVKVNPQYRDAYSNLLLNLNYLPELKISEIYEESKKWAKIQMPMSLASKKHDNTPDPYRKLRIGYISPDFKVHSVMYFFESLLLGHDRNKFELYGYGDVDNPDQKTEKLIEKFDHYHNLINISDEKAAAFIKSDAVDILVDLAGHTGRNRLGILAYKPAPIQVTYLGYPNTTGMPQIDYRLTDAIADTEDQQQYYTEKLVFLPNGFLCYYPGEIQPLIRELPSLSKGHILFGCFNNPKKINPGLVKMWVDLLKRVPNSKLLLKFREGNDEQIKEYLWNLFAEQGLKDPKKHVMIFGAVSYEAHLDVYNSIDIALDTYPYNGTTTTCQALLMGVPVITLAGSHHASRVGLDILSRLDMQFFAAQSPEEYVKKAAVLAAKPEALAKIRSTMRNRLAASPLCNFKIITGDIENAYRQMWHTWCRKQGANVSDIKNKPDASLNIPIPEPEIETVTAMSENDPTEAMPLTQNVGNIATACCIQKQSTKTLQKKQFRKLHIGGKVTHPEWELLNIQAGPGVDHIGDAKDLSQFEDETFDELYASHVVEHFDYNGPLLETFKEWYRVLKPGGKLHISVPDMNILCQLFLKRSELNAQQRFHVMRMMFGGHVDPYDYHYVGLDFELLVNFLHKANFRNFKRVEKFNIFNDTSNFHFAGVPISLNVIASK